MFRPALRILLNTLGSIDTSINNALALLAGDSTSAGSAAGNLAFNVDMDGMWDTVMNLSHGLLDYVCNVILAICILVALAEVAMKVDMLTWEHGLRIGVKIVIAKVCIEVAPSLMWAIYKQVVYLIKDVAATIGVDGSTIGATLAANMAQYDTRVGFWAGILLAIVCLVAFVAIKVLGLLIAVIAFVRIFEILVYAAVSPIPCAFFPLGEGGSGFGVSRITTNFFKSYIAVCLQGVLMALVIVIFNLTASQIVDDMFATYNSSSIVHEETGASYSADEMAQISQQVNAAAQAKPYMSDEDYQALIDSIDPDHITEQIQTTTAESSDDEDASVGTTVFNLSFSLIMLLLALFMCLMRCGNWAKSIMDAR